MQVLYFLPDKLRDKDCFEDRLAGALNRQRLVSIVEEYAFTILCIVLEISASFDLKFIGIKLGSFSRWRL